LLLGGVVAIAAIVLWAVVVSENWITNVIDFNALVFSGVIVVMFATAGGLFYKSFSKTPEVITMDIQPTARESFVPGGPPTTSGDFSAVMSPDQKLHLGDWVNFTVRFKGQLTNGLLQTDVKRRDKIIQTFPNYKTLSDLSPNWFSKGTLNGPIDDKYEWHGIIPETWRDGEYTFAVRVYERILYSRWVAFKLHLLLWLKSSHLISSIDTNVLDQPKWVLVRQQLFEVIISE